MTMPLINCHDLQARLADPVLLLVDCRFDLADRDWGRREYLGGHLPGAVFAHMEHDLSGPLTATSGRHPLPSAQQFAATLGRWGFTAHSPVVAYDQGHGAGAARLWWLLQAAGWPRVQVLDGGLAAWKSAGLPLETGVVGRTPTGVAARELRGWLSSLELQQALAKDAVLLVDARAADRFAGRNETIDPVAGHVPGARCHPFATNLGDDGCFLPADALRARWHTTLAGRGPAALVSMCGSGITGCHNLLAMAQAGLPGGRLYAGSWSEWIRDPARPVARGEMGS
jgi:thiosulfate/3-mercaptopyruvate sulfurtransferase